ncbi:hypothetical protein CSHISOI_03256, partial [Colletotrichum shisoi]
MSTKPVIFFAGGAWHSPEHFRDIRDELHRRGYETEAVAYPSVGAEPPTKGMHDDAAAVRTVLEELAGRGRRIVLVAHSYGGFVGAEAARGMGFEQRAQEGKAGGIVVPRVLITFLSQDGRIHVVAPTEAFYEDVAPEARERAIGLLRHQTMVSFEEALTYEPWRDTACMYVGCEDDGAVPFFMQEQMQQLLGPTAVKLRMKASHSPFLSRIAETADWIETAAGTGQEAVG